MKIKVPFSFKVYKREKYILYNLFAKGHGGISQSIAIPRKKNEQRRGMV